MSMDVHYGEMNYDRGILSSQFTALNVIVKCQRHTALQTNIPM